MIGGMSGAIGPLEFQHLSRRADRSERATDRFDLRRAQQLAASLGLAPEGVVEGARLARAGGSPICQGGDGQVGSSSGGAFPHGKER
jgi:hypothetical protein